jgi:hypothetical protein
VDESTHISECPVSPFLATAAQVSAEARRFLRERVRSANHVG